MYHYAKLDPLFCEVDVLPLSLNSQKLPKFLPMAGQIHLQQKHVDYWGHVCALMFCLLLATLLTFMRTDKVCSLAEHRCFGQEASA